MLKIEQLSLSDFASRSLASLGKLVLAVLIGFTLTEVISSGSFYAFSGTSVDISVAGFVAQLLKYAPHGLYITGMYLTVAALLHVAVKQVSGLKTTV
ncbi:MAG: hypothetical protein QJT81_00970 [Candidatus Thiothrix putei]|uniref:Uncharacterized protein n=1 Tax=Candidatus Thiothrix putei TaxID=3080811 RepID=A0AA95KJM4_9GAMM|nr:MAG: hypothetical protein QJT81_00970 [Candidatus Thiothrix putei]